jgi:hypothetical protein
VKFGRFRTKADMNRQTRSAASVANDPKRTLSPDVAEVALFRGKAETAILLKVAIAYQ